MATNLQADPDTTRESSSGVSVAALLAGIVNDVQELLKQQLALFKHELRRDVERTKEVALSLSVAVPLLLLGGFMLGMMLVALLHEVAGLPWWGSFGIIGGAMFLIGVGLALLARQRMEEFKPVSDPAAEALKENLEWTTKPK
jgi:sterol desaturase/sphingolipid hydroxylase (fatty acid hydroxylase superfamily)